ncbi:MAG: cytochrome d ubiquinol oxidase subunit II [Myxococcota bacterium]|nr:cytochrome d ubiquinol oxidase subunit II [Myxococcota bacterium]
MNATEFVYLTMGVALVVYALSAGADFGAGVWDLLSRTVEQRKALEKAIAPIWEANHVWLIFIIVVMFTAFPKAFALLSIAFHVPLTFVLIGIVLRGAAFVFRSYGLVAEGTRARFGRVFAWASALTPICLGWVLGGMSSGAIVVRGEVVESGYLAGWTTPYAMAVGGFALVLFALLAAVYMTVETDGEVREWFRQRAIACELLAAPVALVTYLLAPAALVAGGIPAQALTAGAACVTVAALWRRRFAVARAAVIAQVALIVIDFGLAMRGDFVLGVVGVANSGTQAPTLPLLIAITLGGSVLLVPSMIALYRQFKSAESPSPSRPS